MPEAPHPLRYREFLKRLSRFGVSEIRHGSGSRRMLFKENIEGLRQSYPIHAHDENVEIYLPIINATLRRFKIAPSTFWDAVRKAHGNGIAVLGCRTPFAQPYFSRLIFVMLEHK